MTGERENFAQMPRRGFLRQLCALPMIGGSVTLIGSPTAVAAPLTEALLDGYDEWLFYERRLLHVERFGSERARQSAKFIPSTGWASEFHFPSMQTGDKRPPWLDRPQPSSRAALVLSAVGVSLKGAARV